MSKRSKTKAPKKLGGVKMPKAVRKAGFMDGLIHSDTGRQLMADALMAAATAAAATLMRGMAKSSGDSRAQSKDGGNAAPVSAADALIGAAAESVAGFVGDTAKKFLPAALTTAPAAEPSPAPTSPKRRASAPRAASRKKPAAASKSANEEA